MSTSAAMRADPVRRCWPVPLAWRLTLVACAFWHGSEVQAQATRHAVNVPVATPVARTRWLTIDAPRHVARIVVQAGVAHAAQPELNFNGAAMGALDFRVPQGWTVELRVSNVGQTQHSARLVADAELPTTIGAAVLAGAETPRAEQGQLPGTSHAVTFRATRAGRFRLACAVPAHGYAGMWIYLTVDPTLRVPEVRQRPETSAAMVLPAPR